MLRKFLRDSVDRESIVASPWIVKPNVAKLYGLDTEMPEDVRERIEDCRKGEAEKRKKVRLFKVLSIQTQQVRL